MQGHVNLTRGRHRVIFWTWTWRHEKIHEYNYKNEKVKPEQGGKGLIEWSADTIVNCLLTPEVKNKFWRVILSPFFLRWIIENVWKCPCFSVSILNLQFWNIQKIIWKWTENPFVKRNAIFRWFLEYFKTASFW